MTLITAAQLRAIVGAGASPAILDGTADGIARHGPAFGLDKPWRLAQFVPQIGHESARFKTTVEYWGPTAAQKRYEGRKDLGNVKPGDGSLFRGHGLIQVTGRANHREFTKWCRARYPDCPDFEKDPARLKEFPWAFLSAVWYWDTRDLNRYADAGNIEAITRKINGGLNGYTDRCDLYARTSLVLLGYELRSGVVRKFQTDAGFTGKNVDDVAGPETRAAMHGRLKVAVPPRPVPVPPEKPVTPPVTPPVAPKPVPVPSGNWLADALAAIGRALAAWFGKK